MNVQSIKTNNLNTNFGASSKDLLTLAEKLSKRGPNYRSQEFFSVADSLATIRAQLGKPCVYNLATEELSPPPPQSNKVISQALKHIRKRLSRSSGEGDLSDFLISTFSRHGKILRKEQGYSKTALPDAHLIAVA